MRKLTHFRESNSIPLDVCSFFYSFCTSLGDKKMVSPQVNRSWLHVCFCLSAWVWRAAERLQLPLHLRKIIGEHCSFRSCSRYALLCSELGQKTLQERGKKKQPKNQGKIAEAGVSWVVCVATKKKKKIEKSYLAAVLVAGICLRAQPYVRNFSALESNCKGELNRFVDVYRVGNDQNRSPLSQVVT